MPVAVEPTSAELVRSVLTAARSLTLTTEGHRAELVGSHTVEASGHLVIDVPADSHLGVEVAYAPGGALETMIEFTDVAPVSVPDRIRVRVSLSGWLRLADGGAASIALRFEPDGITVEEGGRSRDVGLDELRLAEPDPLAETEAELLLHLAGAHQDAVELLSQLVEPRLLTGVTRVDPLRLDRYGIVLRLRRIRGHRDVRLGFPTPLRTPVHAVVQIQTLLARARTCRRV
jgi:hypothetical protein